MSGGHYDYKQNHIQDIIEQLELDLERQGKPREEQYFDNEIEYYKTFPEHVVVKIKEGIKALKVAQVYAQRIDWYLSGDDGEESFLIRLKDELNNINKNE